VLQRQRHFTEVVLRVGASKVGVVGCGAEKWF